MTDLKLSSREIDAMIRKFQPIIYLHSQEEYLPIQFNQYINESRLKNIKTQEDVFHDAPMSDLNFGQALLLHPEYNTSDYTLYLPRGLKSPVIQQNNPDEKQLQEVPLYVHYRLLTGNQLLISYTHMYAYNGPTAICNCSKFQVGEHYADSEHVTLLITVEAVNRVSTLTRMYMARHSGGVWINPEQLVTDDTRPIIFSALNSHASYHTVGDQKRFWGFVKDPCDYGKRWDAKNLIVIQTDDMANIEPKYRWMAFRGALGDGSVSSFALNNWMNELEQDENYGQGCCFKC